MAQTLKQRDLEHLAWDNLIEEVESIVRSQKKEFKSRSLMIIEHLLKLMFGEAEKAQNSRGRRTTVVEQRTQLELWLEDSPSLKSLLQEVFPELYSKARQQTMRKYQLKDTLFPEAAPFDSAQLLVPDFLPK